MTRKERDAIDSFILQLLDVRDKAGRVGLFKTMHVLGDAVRCSGWEYADQLLRRLKPSARSGKKGLR